MKKYAEINIGDTATIRHVITKTDIDRFVQLTGDDNKLHVDEQFAKGTQFKKPVVHGMLGASFISTIIGTKLPGDGALWFSQSLEFLLPVRIGDELTISAEVIRKNDRENVIELKTEIINQNRQVVTRGVSKVKVIETEQPVAETVKVNDRRPGTAIVLGATGGVGKAVCLKLAENGFNVIVHCNTNVQEAENIREVVETWNVRGHVIKADLKKEEEVREMVWSALRKFTEIDVIANCASSLIPNIKFENLVWEDFTRQFDLNIKATLQITQALLPGMMERGYGKVVHVGSLAAEKPNSEWAHYITAKAALAGLTKAMAFELAPKGIRVNMVTPSLLDTDLTSDIPQKVKLLTAAQTPLRRLALVEDVANAVVFLSSPASDFITGENLRVNGGQFMI